MSFFLIPPETMEQYKAMETRMYNLGFREGREKARAELPKDPYAGLETTRSVRNQRKLKRAQELKALAVQRK